MTLIDLVVFFVKEKKIKAKLQLVGELEKGGSEKEWEREERNKEKAGERRKEEKKQTWIMRRIENAGHDDGNSRVLCCRFLQPFSKGKETRIQDRGV